MGNLLTIFRPKYGCQCDPLVAHGATFSQFFGEYLGICLYTGRDRFGYTIGLINLLVLSTVQWPQIYRNFRRGRCDDLSLTMLLAWNVGDISGAIGLLMLGQTRTTAWIQQLYCASVDLILTGQWIYFNCIAKKKKQEDENGNDNEVPLLNDSLTTSDDKFVFFDGSQVERGGPSGSSGGRSGGGGGGPSQFPRDPFLFPIIAILGISLLSHVAEATVDFTPHAAIDLSAVLLCEEPGPAATRTEELIGYLFAFLCSAIYIGAQWPQIYFNWKTKSAEAVAQASLAICIVNYVLYYIAMLTPTTYADQHKFGPSFWLGLGPYLFSFFCCILSCTTLLIQKYIYKKTNNDEDFNHEARIGINNSSTMDDVHLDDLSFS